MGELWSPSFHAKGKEAMENIGNAKLTWVPFQLLSATHFERVMGEAISQSHLLQFRKLVVDRIHEYVKNESLGEVVDVDIHEIDTNLPELLVQVTNQQEGKEAIGNQLIIPFNPGKEALRW